MALAVTVMRRFQTATVTIMAAKLGAVLISSTRSAIVVTTTTRRIC